MIDIHVSHVAGRITCTIIFALLFKQFAFYDFFTDGEVALRSLNAGRFFSMITIRVQWWLLGI